MKRDIIFLTDYKDRFGSKWDAQPYRSGMDKDLLKEIFNQYQYSARSIKFNDLEIYSNIKDNTIFLYTSSEDIGYSYKSYIEDIVLGIQERNLQVVPEFKYLKANNNKVFMEILRENLLNLPNDLSAKIYGVYEDVAFDLLNFPVVFKMAEGSMSQGVFLAKNKKELSKLIKESTKIKFFKENIRDFLRGLKRKGYVKESLYRKKFILQDFIPNLKYDFKILIFGDKYFIFQRPVRTNDFRASGSGSGKYIYGSSVIIPHGIFDFAKKVFNKLDVPHLSLDLAFNGTDFFVIEFQALYFGTVGVAKSDGYFISSGDNWDFKEKEESLEKYYADSIVQYLQKCRDI